MVISIGSANTITSLETALLTRTLQTRTWAFLSTLHTQFLVNSVSNKHGDINSSLGCLVRRPHLGTDDCVCLETLNCNLCRVRVCSSCSRTLRSVCGRVLVTSPPTGPRQQLISQSQRLVAVNTRPRDVTTLNPPF